VDVPGAELGSHITGGIRHIFFQGQQKQPRFAVYVTCAAVRITSVGSAYRNAPVR
jgi:hypothetical protein